MFDKTKIKYFESEIYAYELLINLENQLDKPDINKIQYYEAMIQAFENSIQQELESK